MGTMKVKPYSYGILLIIMLSAISPAFAEVVTLQTNSDSFFKGEQITFSGTVEKNSNGLVTIVIRDIENNFVMLTQALIDYDDSFEKTVKINDKFSKHGVYTATGFILNMTDGDTINFGISLNEVPAMINEESKETTGSNDSEENNEIAIDEIQETLTSSDHVTADTTIGLADFVDASKDPQHYVDRYYKESTYKAWFDRNYPELTIEEAVGYTENVISVYENLNIKTPEPALEVSNLVTADTTIGLADFVDASKDPQHYVDRYYNESTYKAWFDRNYPELTIEEAVGYSNNIEEIKSTVKEIIDSEIVPEADASSSSSIAEPPDLTNNNSEVAEISLAVAGLGILFGAVYGIKRKVDDNSKQISINRETLRKKFIQPIVGSNPQTILQTRLAKGEITLEEYEKLKNKLN